MSKVLIKRLSPKGPVPRQLDTPPDHWVGNPPTSFRNPWPSFGKQHSLWDVFQTRFASNRNFIPVPESRDELVKVRKPDWGRGQDAWETGLKATWLGHAGFLVETASPLEETIMPSLQSGEGVKEAPEPLLKKSDKRGLRILFDAVFSERTSPFTWLGPKRYSPTPCTLAELPDVDLIITSHDHYDHMDLETIKQVVQQQRARGGPTPQFFVGLNNGRHLEGAGIPWSHIHELDWWDRVDVRVPCMGDVELCCTPAQHVSGRGVFDRCKQLWCSWVVIDRASGRRLFFAGDTAYQTVGAPSPCPAFAQIGDAFGPLDLALLPIGLMMPQEFMSPVHCCPEDTLKIHKDVRSRRSIGMHYGTFRGGLSEQYEDVREPPQRWKAACEKEGKWGAECGLCDIGETVIV